MNAPPPTNTFHLLVADDAITDGHRTGTYVAACGALVTTLASSTCPPDCECDLGYCPACVSAAHRWNTELGHTTPETHTDDHRTRGMHFDSCGHPVRWTGPILHIAPCSDCDTTP